MKRKLYDALLRWKQASHGRTAFLVQGAPRSGKSHMAEEFAKKEYKSYIRIDFTSAPQVLKDMFLYDLDDLDTLFMKLEVLYHKKLHRRNSLIILDEVQFFPQIRNAVDALVADRRYDYIETGALLGIRDSLKEVQLPVHVERFCLHPLDFEEFLWATGHEKLMASIRRSFEERKPMGRALHRRAMDALRQYVIVGGMPEAVAEFARSGNFAAVDRVKRDILQFYRDGIQKYARSQERERIQMVFDSLPVQFRNRNMHFKFSVLRPGGRFTEFENPLMWLEEAMVIHCCFRSTEDVFELESPPERTVMKCYAADTGLLVSQIWSSKEIEKEEVVAKLLFGDLEQEMGMLLENVVAQMLASSGHMLRFYATVDRHDRMNRMELDFLLAEERMGVSNRLIPVKVKSGMHYKRSDLRKFIGKYRDRVDVAYDLHANDLKEGEGGIVYLPLYMAMLI